MRKPECGEGIPAVTQPRRCGASPSFQTGMRNAGYRKDACLPRLVSGQAKREESISFLRRGLLRAPVVDFHQADASAVVQAGKQRRVKARRQRRGYGRFKVVGRR